MLYRWEPGCFFEEVRRRIAASAAAATLRATGDVRKGFPGERAEKALRMQHRRVRRKPLQMPELEVRAFQNARSSTRVAPHADGRTKRCIRGFRRSSDSRAIASDCAPEG